MTIQSNIDKALISDMPVQRFDGRIIVVQSEVEAAKAIDYLESYPLVGIDTETRPSFAKGRMHPVALLQVSTNDTCFLFRLDHMGLTTDIVRLLTEDTVIKVGLSLKDDFQRLRQRMPFTPRGYVDLQDYVSRLGIEAMSLQKIYALLFGYKLSKAQRLSNWEADVLTDAQKEYAALDAWACTRIYGYLESLVSKNELVVEPAPAYPIQDINLTPSISNL